ncbi:helix-turn-helix domain-containing protein [Streptomyces mauvecolor]
MGRHEEPVDYSMPSRGALAAFLRNRRRAAGLTYAQLASLTGLSASTLKRAGSGRVTPAESTVEAVVEACGGDTIDLLMGRQFWQLARVEQRGHRNRLSAPHPTLIISQIELSIGLVNLYEQAGAPSLRKIQRRGGPQWLALSSASRIIHRQALPTSRGQMAAFLRACRVPERSQGDWLDAWSRTVPLFRQSAPAYERSYNP